MWKDERSLHNKCKNTENKETKIPIFLSCHRDEDRDKGQLISPNFNGIVIHYGQNQDTLCVYGEHLCRRVTDGATGKKILHKSKH